MKLYAAQVVFSHRILGDINFVKKFRPSILFDNQTPAMIGFIKTIEFK